MTRQQLEHIIRAAAGTTSVNDIIVIGSQSILAVFPDAPKELTESMEADVFPKDAPELAIVIDGAIGEDSLFHKTFGYYAHGVGEETAILPEGWRSRLIKVQTPATMDAIGWCLDAADLATSKLAAGREKDLNFVEAMLRLKIVATDLIKTRLDQTPALSPERKALALARLNRASLT